jgi:Septum formation
MAEPSVEEMIRRSRIARRRAHRAVAFKRWLPKIIVVAAAGTVAVWGIVAGPLHTRRRHPTALNAAVPAVATTTTAASSTTSTTLALEERSYNPGDCVTWDQAASSQRRVTRVVPCTQAHLMEMTGHVTMSGGPTAPYPTPAQWDQVLHGQCGELIAPYLGYPLDPDGRFAAADIKPLPDAWAQQYREVWCGIEAAWPDGQPHPSGWTNPFKGVVKGQDQTYLIPAGTCLGLDLDGTVGAAVPCAGTHAVEVTGAFTVNVASLPASDQAWVTAVGSGCQAATLWYAGGRLPPGMSAGSLQISPTSWAAGRRKVECTAVRYGTTGQLLPTSGSVRRIG